MAVRYYNAAANIIFLLSYIISLTLLMKILRSQYYEIYKILKMRLLFSNGIVMFAITIKIIWTLYVA